MSKEMVLSIMENDMLAPAAYKSGEYLEEHVFNHLIVILQTDREGIIGALQEWIGTKTEPRTMLAVRLATKLGIEELVPLLLDLRDEIKSGKVFIEFYLKYINEALLELKRGR